MTRIYPDLKWYAAQSTERGVPIRCPHANAYSCPRYYQSLALLGEAHIATAIDPKKDEELLAKWKASPLWPLVDEHATSIVNASMFANFCPEVAFDRFGLFATYLARYADEIDREQAERQLVESGVSPTDWAWNWQSAREMHYTDCPLYSQLLIGDLPPQTAMKSGEILSIKPGAFGVSVDVKRLFAWLIRWWHQRKAKGG